MIIVEMFQRLSMSAADGYWGATIIRRYDWQEGRPTTMGAHPMLYWSVRTTGDSADQASTSAAPAS